jgi:hypothetical protein
MVKKRGKKSSSKSGSIRKKSTSPPVDRELSRELNELEQHKYYGHKESSYKPNEQTLIRKKESPSKLYEPEKGEKPLWFYISSIFAAFLFTIYISIFATLHFDDITHMNITIVFLFITLISFFLVSSVYLISEKRKMDSYAPITFFIGLVFIMIYAFKAIDASDLVRYSIIYTIIVAAVSTYALTIKKR